MQLWENRKMSIYLQQKIEELKVCYEFALLRNGKENIKQYKQNQVW